MQVVHYEVYTVKVRPLRVLMSLVAVSFLLLVSESCSNDRTDLTVFAAASLADVLPPLGERFESEKGIKVNYSFGGSWTLAQQVSLGAPADVFVAGGPGPMDVLDDKNLLANGSRVDLLGNMLVIVAKGQHNSETFSPTDLLRDDVKRIAMGDPSLAPAGNYAREALQTLGLWAELREKLVYGLNVRAALKYVRSGNSDVAIVYATDVARDEQLRLLWAFPPETHSSIRYPVAAIAESDNSWKASEFLAFLRSEVASEIFSEHGFNPMTLPE